MNCTRTSVDPAEVEKLLNEKNVDGSYKYHLKGDRIFYLLTLFTQSNLFLKMCFLKRLFKHNFLKLFKKKHTLFRTGSNPV